MSTLVCFHAHPDDEAIATGGLMAKASAAGHRVVLVTATRGEQGEPEPGVLGQGESLGDRRMVELQEAAKILGAEEPIMLGYVDSGMMGEPENENPECFWQADPYEAAQRLASILTRVGTDVLTVYDDHGGYGHPDHLKVHTVGLAAARLAGVTNVYESTMNRDRIKMMMAAQEAGELDPATDKALALDRPALREMDKFGTLEQDMSFQIDVSQQIDLKHQAMSAHRSQIGPDSFFLLMPKHTFAMAFDTEWFNCPGITGTGGPAPVDLLPGL